MSMHRRADATTPSQGVIRTAINYRLFIAGLFQPSRYRLPVPQECRLIHSIDIGKSFDRSSGPHVIHMRLHTIGIPVRNASLRYPIIFTPNRTRQGKNSLQILAIRVTRFFPANDFLQTTKPLAACIRERQIPFGQSSDRRVIDMHSFVQRTGAASASSPHRRFMPARPGYCNSPAI
jgi:hypothetical protein